MGEQGGDGLLEMPLAIGPDDLCGSLDVGLAVAGADAGYGHARGLGQVGQPVGAGRDVLAGVGEQQPDVPVGLLLALARVGQGRQQRIASRLDVAPAGAVVAEHARVGH